MPQFVAFIRRNEPKDHPDSLTRAALPRLAWRAGPLDARYDALHNRELRLR